MMEKDGMVIKLPVVPICCHLVAVFGLCVLQGMCGYRTIKH